MTSSLTGIVIRNQNDKTAYVRVERWRKHPLYGKYIRKHKVYAAHDEENQCQIGDRVLMRESRPVSKTKTWRVQEIVASASSRLKKDDSKTE